MIFRARSRNAAPPERPFDPSGLSSGAAWRLLTRRRRIYILLIETLLIVAVAVIGHITGREMGRRHLHARDQTILQLREERQGLSAELNRRSERIQALQTRLNAVQKSLDEIVPSENVYIVRPNQSLIVANGRVTIGLIDSPANQHINLNVNGKAQNAAAGDVIAASSADGAACQVTVQSFDMFKAILHAVCAGKRAEPTSAPPPLPSPSPSLPDQDIGKRVIDAAQERVTDARKPAE